MMSSNGRGSSGGGGGGRNSNCIHGTLVNETCVCDLLWQGDACDLRDCQAGQLRDGICHCHLRHAGEFCEYQACYHKDLLYCWGLTDVQFLPCNASAIGGHVDPETVGNPAWYCPCNQGRRTPPPYSHCVCNRGYAGEFCANKLCVYTEDCTDGSIVYGGAAGRPPYYGNSNPDGSGIVVPDSVKVAMVAMSMVVLVALIVWLKRLCIRRRAGGALGGGGGSMAGDVTPNLRVHYGRHQHHPLTPAQLSATLLMLQQGRQSYPYGFEAAAGSSSGPNAGRHGPTGQRPVRPAPLPSYEEANSAPPSYASVVASRKPSSSAAGFGLTPRSRKESTVSEGEAGVASSAHPQGTSKSTLTVQDTVSAISLQSDHGREEESAKSVMASDTGRANRRRSL